MRPLAVITAIILGSAAAITFGLVGVLIVFLVLKNHYPQFLAELGLLTRSSAMFAGLSLVAATALYGQMKALRWGWIAQLAMWFSLVGVGFAFWPR